MNDIKHNLFIASKSAVDVKGGMLRIKTEEQENVIAFGEIRCLFLEDLSASISAKALLGCVENSIAVLVCNNKHQPAAELFSLSGTTTASGALSRQLSWALDLKRKLTMTLFAKQDDNADSLSKANEQGVASNTPRQTKRVGS